MGSRRVRTQEASRVSRHRKRVATGGAKRVEVTVPSRDAPLLKAIAGALCADGEEAVAIRRSIPSMLTAPKARTGAELVAFLRASPLTNTDLPIERDRSIGRPADLG